MAFIIIGTVKVAVYRVGVANESELNTSPCTLTLDFAGKRTKNTEGELENNIPENCACSLYEQQRTHRQNLHTF